MEAMRQFMVTFKLPEELTYEFMNKIPAQKKAFDNMLSQGYILSYSLSMNRRFLWVIFIADSKKEVKKQFNKLPLINHLTAIIEELAFHNASYPLPAVSLN